MADDDGSKQKNSSDAPSRSVAEIAAGALRTLLGSGQDDDGSVSETTDSPEEDRPEDEESG